MSNKIDSILCQIDASDAIIFEGTISVLSVLSSDNSKILKIILKQDPENRNIQKVLKSAKEKNIETEFFSSEELEELGKVISDTKPYNLGRTHGGIIAVILKREFISPLELINKLPKNPSRATIAIIEGIEDPYNLGYAARALYTQGIDGLIIPERDFGFSESIIEKASTGTFYKMPVAVFPNSSKDENAKINLIDLLKKEKYKIYCIDKKAPANSKIKVNDIFDVKFNERTVFIIGGEKRGISKDFLNNADEIVRIPYAKNFSHSLAAQTAATVISYEIHRQTRVKL